MKKPMYAASLPEIVDRILDKGLVIDFWIALSLLRIELLRISGRVVVASIPTWLDYVWIDYADAIC
ncbi:gas vesicle protein GvpJ [Clostridium sp. ZS2-4]|uniref:gas vesicle protein GvpJ n=1 Tax=Clostridium sp. ZS2-4 TaxID=2987703 RepID=UPI00227CF03D|nr:gas vesicle protein GvpJ [Clostridium sp. ZS2-4]MCY6354436.1 gas vesicle protein [Clostridium sp. ZS2-4]